MWTGPGVLGVIGCTSKSAWKYTEHFRFHIISHHMILIIQWYMMVYSSVSSSFSALDTTSELFLLLSYLPLPNTALLPSTTYYRSPKGLLFA